jgi:hypothetical protein
VQQYLAIIEEINLEQLITQSKHNCVSRLQPLLDEDEIIVLLEL